MNQSRKQEIARFGWTFVILSSIALMVSFGRVDAEIGFRRTSQSEQLRDPSRTALTQGLVSTVSDDALVDTTLSDTTAIDTIHISPPLNRPVDIQPPPEIPIDITEEPRVPGGQRPSPVELEPFPGQEDQPEADDQPESSGENAVEEIPRRATRIFRIDLPVEMSVELDTATGYVVLKQQLYGVDMPVPGAIAQDAYIDRAAAAADRETWRQSVMDRLPTESDIEGTGINISIPVFRSKRAQRIFGGANIGLNVSGSINVDGSMRVEKREELQQENINPTSYQFKVNQTQQFIIKGKVGEKITVEIDQNSERLFEFENNLKVIYQGYEDEIIQTIQAGNVDLSLRGGRLASASAKNMGLFGFKTISQVGPLKLTTIASLEKGEKKKITIEGGAQTGAPIRIKPNEFVQGRYFYLDETYREHHKFRRTDLSYVALPADQVIVYIDVYRSITPYQQEETEWITGWALYDPDPSNPDTASSDKEHQPGNFRRLQVDIDYEVNRDLGYIRLKQSVDMETILAVAYTTPSDTVGDPDPSDNNADNPIILKLLRPANPQPSDSTWSLMWRNVYDLGAIGIDPEGFEGKITATIGGGPASDTGIDTLGQARSYLEMFGLDFYGTGGEGPDNIIDDEFINYSLGELIFPDPHPFAPEGWILEPDQPQGVPLPDSVFSPDLYVTTGRALNDVSSDFQIEVKYRSVSAVYDLGYNVLEGSEEVYRNGQRLNRGTDYTIDYLTGSLKLSGQVSAIDNIEIKYESGQLFQLDTKTLLGLSAEYALWDNSFVEMTFLYMNQRTMDRRVQVGGEPLRNSIWDINTQLTFKPMFLTRAVDWLPLIETDAPSTFTINAEVAQVFPDPNSLNSPSTGDHNGVAYLDDFESIRRSTPLGIGRKLWTAASFPEYDRRGEMEWKKQRGRLIWYNPEQVKITDIWPEREVETSSATTPVLQVEFQPWWDAWGVDRPDDGIDPSQSWGGIMRYLGAGYADQSESKYIEIWLKRGRHASGVMYIDLGRISEDVIPNGVLDNEDQPYGGRRSGNGILDAGEDTGLDGVAGPDPTDSTYVNDRETLLPSYDDWNYSFQNKYDYTKINGTEDNGKLNGGVNDEGGRYPDTEDLNGNTFLDQADSFLRYRVDLGEGDMNRYIVGGLAASEDKGWRLYRIPLTDTLEVNDPSLTAVEYVRIWFTGFDDRTSVTIAQFDIVGNEWQEVEVENNRGETYDPLSVAVINTHDNPEYDPPPGVAGEIDPATGLRGQEQSLVLRVNRLGTGETGTVEKRFYRDKYLLEYRRLKMFVSGGGASERLVDRFGRDLDLELFLRFGDGSSNSQRYYEYSQRLNPGWSSENEIIIDFDRLSSLKFLRQQDSLRNYDILPNGDVIRVVGEPSLAKIGFLTIGIKNHGQPITAEDEVEIWVDELRVSDIQSDPGWAATGRMELKVADLVTLSGDLEHRQAAFHNVNTRVQKNAGDELSGSLRFGFNLDRFFPTQWGLKLPISASYRQRVDIPQYQPGSDIELSAISGERIDIWSVFGQNIWDNSRLYGNIPNPSPMDSMITTSKQYDISFRASKTKKSDNPWIRSTIDGLNFHTGLSEKWRSGPTYRYDHSRTINGETSYSFSFGEPWEVMWLGWTRSVPLLGRLSESVLSPLPSSLSFSTEGTETIVSKESRQGRLTDTYRLNLSRRFRTSWRPLSVLTADFSMDINSTRIRDDSTRTNIARNAGEAAGQLDSLEYWQYEGTDSAYFDSLGWAERLEQEIASQKDAIFWNLFGAQFVDQRLSQSFSVSYRPDILTWLGTDAGYNARYNWIWGDRFGPADRQVSVSNSFSTGLTLRLPQIVTFLEDVTRRGEPGQGSGDGQPPDQDGMPIPKPMPVPGEMPPPSGGIPAPMDIHPSDDELSEPVLLTGENEDAAVDTTKPPDQVQADTIIVKKRKRPLTTRDMLVGVTVVLRRLRDIRWDYTFSGNVSNNSVEPGQAAWDYRLGFTKYPGLSRVSGYIATDRITRRDEHRISSGLEITDNLSISNMSYNFSQTHNQTISQVKSESGSDGRTVWYGFESDDLTIWEIPILNWSARWSGWESLPVLNQLATSVTFENGFQGRSTQQWERTANDTARRITRTEYERRFTPLLGISFTWKGGIGSSIRYSTTETVMEGGLGTKTRNNTRTITASASYSLRKGIRIPFWPFRNKRLKNNTSFSFSYNNTLTSTETSTDNAAFEEGSRMSSWTVSPEMTYTFSSTVRGSVRYEYAVRRTKRDGKTSSQDLRFSVNISIRG